MSGPLLLGLHRLGIKAASSWDKSGSSGWNNRDWQRGQSSVPDTTISIPSSFVSDWECYDTTPVSHKKFFRNIQSTPWSTKSGLAGKDVACPTESFKALFSSSRFLKQCSSRTCFARSDKSESIWMPLQLICMARRPQTSVKSLRDLCSLFWEKLFQLSRRKQLLATNQLVLNAFKYLNILNLNYHLLLLISTYSH